MTKRPLTEAQRAALSRGRDKAIASRKAAGAATGAALAGTLAPAAHSTYDAELAITICHRVAAGETVLAICRDPAMPARRTFYDWVIRYPELRRAYDAARELQAHALFDEALGIARDLKERDFESAKVNALRHAIDHLRWAASKLNAAYAERANPAAILAIQINTPLDLGSSGRQIGPAPGESLYAFKAVVDVPASLEVAQSQEQAQATRGDRLIPFSPKNHEPARS